MLPKNEIEKFRHTYTCEGNYYIYRKNDNMKRIFFLILLISASFSNFAQERGMIVGEAIYILEKPRDRAISYASAKDFSFLRKYDQFYSFNKETKIGKLSLTMAIENNLASAVQWTEYIGFLNHIRSELRSEGFDEEAFSGTFLKFRNEDRNLLASVIARSGTNDVSVTIGKLHPSKPIVDEKAYKEILNAKKRKEETFEKIERQKEYTKLVEKIISGEEIFSTNKASLHYDNDRYGVPNHIESNYRLVDINNSILEMIIVELEKLNFDGKFKLVFDKEGYFQKVVNNDSTIFSNGNIKFKLLNPLKIKYKNQFHPVSFEKEYDLKRSSCAFEQHYYFRISSKELRLITEKAVSWEAKYLKYGVGVSCPDSNLFNYEVGAIQDDVLNYFKVSTIRELRKKTKGADNGLILKAGFALLTNGASLLMTNGATDIFRITYENKKSPLKLFDSGKELTSIEIISKKLKSIQNYNEASKRFVETKAIE